MVDILNDIYLVRESQVRRLRYPAIADNGTLSRRRSGRNQTSLVFIFLCAAYLLRR